MGKAAVELADPPPGVGANPANADELLSQMAGEEIDRLLAEAEVEPESDPVAAAQHPKTATPEQANLANAENNEPDGDFSADAALSPSTSESSSGADNPAAHDEVADALASADLAPQLDALFDQLNAVSVEQPEPPAADAPAGNVQVTHAPAAAAHAPTAAPTSGGLAQAAEAVMHSAETVAHAATPAADANHKSAHAAAPKKTGALSPLMNLLVIPLELLNQPFGDCSDSLRQGLGWIGIVTTVNAIAVLAYVMLFRRR